MGEELSFYNNVPLKKKYAMMIHLEAMEWSKISILLGNPVKYSIKS